MPPDAGDATRAIASLTFRDHLVVGRFAARWIAQ
jgi:hypothetical protein